MAKVITIASGKGGTGKTVLVANLGIALANQGKSILLIDADIAMANLSLILNMQYSPITLHDVLLGEAAINDGIYEGPAGIDLIPSGLSLESYSRIDPNRLKSVVESIKNRYDFVLIDAPAGIERNALIAISCADSILLVTEPTPAAIADALKTKMISQKLGIPVIGVIINMVRNEKGEIAKEEITKILELPSYGEILYDKDIRKTFCEKKQPIILSKPNSQASKEITNIAWRIIGEKIIKEEKKESFIKRIISKLLRRT